MSDDNQVTREECEAMLLRAEKATPGPWEADTSSPEDCVIWADDGTFLANVGSDRMFPVRPDGAALLFDVDIKNADMVAHARTDLPRLARAHLQLLDSVAEQQTNLSEMQKKITILRAERNRALSRVVELEGQLARVYRERDDSIAKSTEERDRALSELSAARKDTERLEYLLAIYRTKREWIDDALAARAHATEE